MEGGCSLVCSKLQGIVSFSRATRVFSAEVNVIYSLLIIFHSSCLRKSIQVRFCMEQTLGFFLLRG